MNRVVTDRETWLYAVANLTYQIPYAAVSTTVLFFFVDVRQLPATIGATVMTLYALYNAVNNPVLGYLADRTRTRFGRRLPWLMFGTLPFVAAFALIWFAPFDGATQPLLLALWFALSLALFDGLGTLVGTSYYSLLPEMFTTYRERTTAAARMNIIQPVGLIVGAALPQLVASQLGWGGMGVLFGALAAIAMFIGLRGMFERRGADAAVSLSLREAARATALNRSFLTLATSQTMRYLTTATLSTGMAFYIKYTIKADPAQTTLILGVAFISAALSVLLWRKFVASRAEARTTTLLAYGVQAVSVIPLLFVTTLAATMLAATFIGFGLGGLLLTADVMTADVIDEDEVKTHQRREGMYFGVQGLLVTLSTAISAVLFGIIAPAYGYQPDLAVQPATVDMGFRLYLVAPSFIGSILAIVILLFYPLHGARLARVRATLAERRRLEASGSKPAHDSSPALTMPVVAISQK